MKMIEISYEKKHKMAELIEDSLRSLGKVMNCLEQLSEEDSEEMYMKHGRYGSMSRKHHYNDEEETDYRRKY